MQLSRTLTRTLALTRTLTLTPTLTLTLTLTSLCCVQSCRRPRPTAG